MLNLQIRFYFLCLNDHPLSFPVGDILSLQDFSKDTPPSSFPTPHPTPQLQAPAAALSGVRFAERTPRLLSAAPSTVVSLPFPHFPVSQPPPPPVFTEAPCFFCCHFLACLPPAACPPGGESRTQNLLEGTRGQCRNPEGCMQGEPGQMCREARRWGQTPISLLRSLLSPHATATGSAVTWAAGGAPAEKKELSLGPLIGQVGDYDRDACP